MECDIERELLRAYIDSANDGIFVVCDEMKFQVDGSPVRNIARDATDFAMVEAINRLGGALDLETTAEFVETEATPATLARHRRGLCAGLCDPSPEPLFVGNRSGLVVRFLAIRENHVALNVSRHSVRTASG